MFRSIGRIRNKIIKKEGIEEKTYQKTPKARITVRLTALGALWA